MAVVKQVIVQVDVNDAVQSVEKLNSSIEKVNETVKDTGEASKKTMKQVEDGSKGASSGLSKVGTAFKGIGTAIKAAGIGLVIAAFAAFAKVLGENQVVMDKVRVAWEFVSIALNDLVNYIVNNAEPVWKRVKEFWDNLTFENIGKAIQDNLIERFASLNKTLGLVWEAFKKLISGDFSGAWNDIKDAAKESVDVLTGVNNTVDRTVEGVNNLVDAVANYAKETLKAAEANVKLAKAAEIAVAQQAQLVEIYDRQAEKLRQIRDDESKSVVERIKANDELLEVLAKQEKAMLAQADAIIANAQAQYNKNQNDQNYIALIDAQTNKLGVLAQIEGLRSEQKVNEVALDKELLELSQSKINSDTQLALEAKRFAAERITDEEVRIARLRELLEEEKVIERERLQAIIDATNEGTQARVDAEIALNERMQELDQQLIANKTVVAKKEVDLKQEIVTAAGSALDQLISIAGAETALGKTLLIAKQVQAAAEIAIGIAKIKFKATEVAATATLNAAQGTTAVATGAASTLSIGFPAAIPLLIAYAAAAVGIVASIVAAVKGSKKVASQYGGTVSGGDTSSVAAPSISAPSFNVVGTSGENQLAQTIAGQQQQPLKAYVVSTEMSSQQALDRNIENEASF